MSNNFLNEEVKRQIVMDGVHAWYCGNLAQWSENYSNVVEDCLPCEVNYVSDLRAFLEKAGEMGDKPFDPIVSHPGKLESIFMAFNTE